MRSPDVIGHIEILDLPTLQSLAQQVNADAVAASEPNPGYQALLIPAPLGGTQNVGFLVKTSRVRIDGVSQERAGDTFTNPANGQNETLHDRPPLVLRATVEPSGPNPRPAIVVVNHLRSFIDIELTSPEGARVRAKRKAQAESVAGLLQELQTLNPGVAVISIGDYNAYQFNDGYTDPIATLKGTPTPDDQLVVDESPDLVNPNFANLTDGLPPAERYSFIFAGTPQALDHVLVNTVRRIVRPALRHRPRQRRFPGRGGAVCRRPDAAGTLVGSRHARGVLPVPAAVRGPARVDLGRQLHADSRRTDHLHDHPDQRWAVAGAAGGRQRLSARDAGAHFLHGDRRWRVRWLGEHTDGDIRDAGARRVAGGDDCRRPQLRGARWFGDSEHRACRLRHCRSQSGQQRRGCGGDCVERSAGDYRSVGEPERAAAAAPPDGAGDDRLHRLRLVRSGHDVVDGDERRAGPRAAA